MFLFFPRKTSRWVVSALFAFALVLPMRAGAAQALPRCCVWRVTNAKAPFYLVGSIHTLTKKDYPLPVAYEIALRDSRRLLFEFDPTRHAEFEKKFVAAAKYPRGQESMLILGAERGLKLDVSTAGWITNRGGSRSISWTRIPTPRSRLFTGSTITSWIEPNK